MKFDVDDKNKCRLVCVKFHLNRCRFAVDVAKMFRGLTFLGHSVHNALKRQAIKKSEGRLKNRTDVRV